jgi:hypothetical protein
VPALCSSQTPEPRSARRAEQQERKRAKPSPKSKTQPTLTNLQKATKQRNEAEIKVPDREAEVKIPVLFLAVAISFSIFSSPYCTLMFNRLYETEIFFRREQRSAFTTVCCAVSYFMLKFSISPIWPNTVSF